MRVHNVLIFTSKNEESAIKRAKLYESKYEICVIFSEKRGLYEVYGRAKDGSK